MFSAFEFFFTGSRKFFFSEAFNLAVAASNCHQLNPMLRYLLFSNAVGKLVLFSCKFTRYIARLFHLLFLQLGRPLRVRELSINNSLLLRNGILIIRWKCRRFFYARIKGVTRTYNREEIQLVFRTLKNPVVLELHGLFTKQRFVIFFPGSPLIETKRFCNPVIKVDMFASILRGKSTVLQLPTVQTAPFSVEVITPFTNQFTVTIPSPNF